MTEQLVIPAHINSLADYIEEIFNKYNHKPAYAALGQTMSFDEIDSLSAQFGA
jgi:long-chain acyl-CoA synthetase